MIFFAAQVLPGDVARRILGPFADQASVDALSEELGTDQPLLTQYWDWISGFVTGDFGESTGQKPPGVGHHLADAIVASGKLALLAFIIVVPLAIFGGVSRRCTRAASATA